MKDKIELTFAAFKRWVYDLNVLKSPEHHWQSLCAEAEKREPLYTWAIYDESCNHVFGNHRTKEEADEFVKEYKSNNYRVIKLVEEQEG
jgi:hypothetical protein